MRIFLLCNDDLTTHTIFSHVLKSQQFTVAGIAFTTSYTSKDKGILGALRLLKKMSWRYWVFLVASNGAFKLHEKMLLLFGRAYPPSGLFNMRLWAKENNIPVYSSDNFNHPQFIKIVQSAKPDLILLRINQILHAEILNTPVYGCWCIHSSLLPAYKGIAGEFHALRNAEKIIGSTIFNVEEKLDEGARLYQTSFAVEPQNSLLHHIYKNNHLAGALLFNKLCEFQQTHKITPDLIETSLQESYFSWPQANEVSQFRKSFAMLRPIEMLKLLLGKKPL